MSDGAWRITVTERGPYRVEAGLRICDAEGNPIETRAGQPFFLCRCGHSSNKPFCDGTHNRVEWSPGLADRSD